MNHKSEPVGPTPPAQRIRTLAEYMTTLVDDLVKEQDEAYRAVREHKAAAIGFMQQRTQAEEDRDEARRLHALAAGNADQFDRELRDTKQLLDASNAAEEHLQERLAEAKEERDRINRDAERHARRAEEAEGEVARLKGIIKAEPHNMLGHMTSTLRLVIPLMIQLEALVAPDKRDPESSGSWGNPGAITYKAHIVLINVASLYGLAQQYATYMKETGDNPGDLFSAPQTTENGPIPANEQPW